MGEVVEIMGGIVMTEAEFQTFLVGTSRFNAMQIGEGLHLVEPQEVTAARRGSINHSCDSNLWMGDEVTVIARRDIAAGEELTVDYALCTAQPDWRLDSECRCGSPSCRHLITGSDWERPDVQERYEGHFSPFLNARIARLRGPQP